MSNGSKLKRERRVRYEIINTKVEKVFSIPSDKDETVIAE